MASVCPKAWGTAPIDLAFLEDNLTVEVRDDGSVGVEMPLDFWGELGEFPQGEDWRITLRWTVAMPYEIVATNGTVSDDGREVSWVRDAALDAPAEVMYARTGPRGGSRFSTNTRTVFWLTIGFAVGMLGIWAARAAGRRKSRTEA